MGVDPCPCIRPSAFRVSAMPAAFIVAKISFRYTLVFTEREDNLVSLLNHNFEPWYMSASTRHGCSEFSLISCCLPPQSYVRKSATSLQMAVGFPWALFGYLLPKCWWRYYHQ